MQYIVQLSVIYLKSFYLDPPIRHHSVCDLQFALFLNTLVSNMAKILLAFFLIGAAVAVAAAAPKSNSRVLRTNTQVICILTRENK